jgi:cysteine-rich repeat protein
VDVSHTNAADLDVFLTSPSGKRIDLVTDLGGGNDDLYEGTTFDDQAGTPVTDTTVPANGTAFTRVTGEGALAAFMGENPNGSWTLTVVDDTSTYNGRLNGWSLTIVTATACGDGVVDAGEQCDDGNVVDGDGCDANCTPTACGNGVISPGEDCDDGNTVSGDACPSTCRNGETDCGDCVDNDSNALVDAADPACEPAALDLRSASLTAAQGKLRIRGGLALPEAAGPVSLVLADGNGALLCTALGELAGRRRTFSVKGAIGNGSVSLKLVRGKRGNTLTLRGRGLDLGALDSPTLAVGLAIGGQRFSATGPLRPRGARWIYP